MGQIIKGKPVADFISANVKKEAENLRSSGIIPKLMIVRVGEREDDKSYERGALKRMEACSIEAEVKVLPLDISQEDFIEKLEEVNSDSSVHGILLFRPLPKQLDENKIKHIISPEKDVDCLNPLNVAKVTEGDKAGFAPCTPSAVIEILKYYNIAMMGKEAAVLGRSLVVGKPLSMLLLRENATVTVCHSKTQNLSEVTSRADILIAAVGKARMVTAEYVKEGAAVIDVGINVDNEGRLCGDANTESCVEKAAYVTPVPSGVGSVTTSVLAKHVVQACKMMNHIE